MDVLRAVVERSHIHSRRHRKLRTQKLRAVLILLVVVAGLGGATDVAYGSLKSQGEQLQSNLTSQLQAGQRELEAGKDALKQANAKHDMTLVTRAIAHFDAAKGNFKTTSRLADESILLRYLAYAPSVGESVRSRHSTVDAVAEMGAAISDAGLNLSILDGELIRPAPSGDAGRTFLTVLNQVHAGLAKVRDDLSRARKAATQVHVEVLPSGQQIIFTKARESIDSALVGFSEFERLVPILTDVLGGNGPRTYLVEQVNPAELRAGGGFIGSYSLLRADGGSLKLLRSGDSYPLVDPRPRPWQPGFIPMPMPYREVIPDTSWSFIDSNIYPDFPSNARTAENFVEPRLGHLDGVIAMDYYAVAKLLGLTGPMDVPGHGLRVDENNFISLSIRHDISDFGPHKLIFSALAGPLMERVASLPPDRWPTLLSILNGLASERHLQAYFNDAALEDEMDRIGWSGRLNTNHSEFLMEVESNYYGTKSNYWVNRHYSIALSRNGGLLHHRIAVDVVNSEPCGLEERGTYWANIRVYVSGLASSLSHNLRAVRYGNPAPPPDTKMMDGWLFVNCSGGHSQGVFEYDTPWPARDKAGWTIYWQKQPGTGPDGFDVSWDYGDGVGEDKATWALGQDRVFTLLPSGLSLRAGNPAEATLPSLGL
jgi:hypothetical protein